MQSVLERMLKFGFPTTAGTASLFVIGLVILYIICYTRVFEQKEDQHRFIIYATAAAYLLFGMFSGYDFYRILVLVPFVYLMILQNTQYFRLNIICDIVMNLCSLLMMVLRHSPIFWNQWMEHTYINKYLGPVSAEKQVYDSLYDLLNQSPQTQALIPLFCGLFVGCGLVLLALNYPNKKWQIPLRSDRCERWLIWIRTLSILPFYLGALYCFFHIVG